MAKAKAELIKVVRELEKQRQLQYNRIQELQQERDTEKAAADAAREELDRRSLALTKEQDRVITLEGELREKNTEHHNAQRSFDRIRDAVARERDEWREQSLAHSNRIRALEKLLVHNGKAIGALSDLAGEKHRNDELPF